MRQPKTRMQFFDFFIFGLFAIPMPAYSAHPFCDNPIDAICKDNQEYGRTANENIRGRLQKKILKEINEERKPNERISAESIQLLLNSKDSAEISKGLNQIRIYVTQLNSYLDSSQESENLKNQKNKWKEKLKGIDFGSSASLDNTIERFKSESWPQQILGILNSNASLESKVKQVQGKISNCGPLGFQLGAYQTHASQAVVSCPGQVFVSNFTWETRDAPLPKKFALKYIDSTEMWMTHEVGHGIYWQIARSNPEALKKFKDCLTKFETGRSGRFNLDRNAVYGKKKVDDLAEEVFSDAVSLQFFLENAPTGETPEELLKRLQKYYGGICHEWKQLNDWWKESFGAGFALGKYPSLTGPSADHFDAQAVPSDKRSAAARLIDVAERDNHPLASFRAGYPGLCREIRTAMQCPGDKIPKELDASAFSPQSELACHIPLRK